MKKRYIAHITLLATLLAMLVPAGANASAPTVKAKLDSLQILMGRLTTLRMEVVQDAGVPGGFVMFRDAKADGIVGVCGDSVELRTAFKRDTTKLGSGRIQINYEIPVQAFDSGFYRLPEFVYVAGKDTALSNRVSLKVVPVEVGADDPISDYANVADPDGKSIFDALPDAVVNYWWAWLLLLIFIALFIYGYVLYKKRGSILPRKPEPTPYEKAVKALEELRKRKLWESGQEREYFTQLTEILRQYLFGRFGINAMEMTTRQINDTLASNPEVKEKRGYMRDILDIADFVKFARVRPLPADNIAAFDKAVAFVEETKPVEVKPEEENADTDSKTPAAPAQTGVEKKGGEA